MAKLGTDQAIRAFTEIQSQLHSIHEIGLDQGVARLTEIENRISYLLKMAFDDSEKKIAAYIRRGRFTIDLSRIQSIADTKRKHLSNLQTVESHVQSYLDELKMIKSFEDPPTTGDQTQSIRRNRISAFLSHAYKDRELAGKLSKELKWFGIEVFVAHDDIEGGKRWMDMLLEEIKNCDIFLVLLTNEYHGSNFTEQEAGAAVALGKPVVPISLEGAEGYGFITRYQYAKITKDLHYEKVLKLAGYLYKEASNSVEGTLELLINAFGEASSYKQANNVALLLLKYQDFSQEQANRIAKLFVANRELRAAFKAKDFLRTLVDSHSEELDPELRRKLDKYL